MALKLNAGDAQPANQPQVDLPKGDLGADTASFNAADAVLNGQAAKGLGFFNNFMLKRTEMGSEYTNRVGKIMKDYYEKELPGSAIRVDILDKEYVTHLAYSSVIVSLKTGNNVSYYTVLLAATGRAAKQARELAAEYEKIMRVDGRGMQYDPLEIFTYDQAIDGIYEKEIIRILAAVYPDVKPEDFISLDGIVLPHMDHETEKLAQTAAAIAYNALLVDSQIGIDPSKDLNIALGMTQVGNAQLRTTKMFGKASGAKNALGQPIRSDWTIGLEAVDNSRKTLSLNTNANVSKITQVSGYVDAIPRLIESVGPANTVIQTRKLMPHIVLTNVEVASPTPAFMLLALISATPMTNIGLWGATWTQRLKELGALNIVVNSEGDTSGVGKALALDSSKITREAVVNFVKDAFVDTPAISIDIESFGPHSFYTSLFSAAVNPINAKLREVAARKIVDCAHQLTNGYFAKDFPINDIFVDYGVQVPLGVWADKKGEHDLREIDLGFIAANTGDTILMSKLAASNRTKQQTSLDPFQAKAEVIAAVTPDAIISGKATRVTFTAHFISELLNAASSCGFIFSYEVEESFIASQGNWFTYGNSFNNAGINVNAINGIAREFVGQTGSSYYTPYTNMGAYRGWN